MNLYCGTSCALWKWPLTSVSFPIVFTYCCFKGDERSLYDFSLLKLIYATCWLCFTSSSCHYVLALLVAPGFEEMPVFTKIAKTCCSHPRASKFAHICALFSKHSVKSLQLRCWFCEAVLNVWNKFHLFFFFVNSKPKENLRIIVVKNQISEAYFSV